MALQVSADAIRALIPDGLYYLQSLEQRETQRLVVTLILASRGGYTLQLDTTETHILALFQHLLTTAPLAHPPGQRSRGRRQRTTAAEKPPERLPATSVAPTVDGSSIAPRRMRRSRQSSRDIR
ncbi:MAG TPA: hypothetical protein VIH59_16195 [Candidatus Tectomicrobia bacterium]|jgi:hypothetical protein